MAISDVQLKNNFYQIFDGNGKKSKEIHSSSVGELCGTGIDFMVFLKNNFYSTFDENFKRIKEIHKSSVGDFKSSSDTPITPLFQLEP